MLRKILSHNFLSNHEKYIGCVLFCLDDIFCVLIFAHCTNLFIYNEIIIDCCLEPESSNLKSSFDWRLFTKIVTCTESLGLEGSSGPIPWLKTRIRENRWPGLCWGGCSISPKGRYPTFCGTEVRLTGLVLLSSFL